MLYGRDVERTAIKTLLDGARAGRGGVLVLRGQAGAGKSALLNDAARLASSRSLSCRSPRCTNCSDPR
jgi:predicted ATPase